MQRADSDEAWRFCQQCGKLELLTAFDGTKRSCRRQLARRRETSSASRSTKASASAQSQPLPAVSVSVHAAAPAYESASQAQSAQHTLTAPLQPASFLTEVGAAASSTGNPALEQQVQLCQERCAMLRMQIDMLEAQQASAGVPAHQQEVTIGATAAATPAAAADEDDRRPAVAGYLSPTKPRWTVGAVACTPAYNANAGAFPAEGVQAVLTYTPVFGFWGGLKGQGMDAVVGMEGMGSSTSTSSAFCGTGTSLPLPAVLGSGCSSRTDPCMLLPGSGAFNAPPAFSTGHCAMQQQQVQAAAVSAPGHFAHAAAVGAGACMTGYSKDSQAEGAKGCSFLPSNCIKAPACSSLSWACPQQQMMLQPPVHVAQMLAAANTVNSGPMANWCTSAGMPALAGPATSGAEGRSFLPVYINRTAGDAAGACGAGVSTGTGTGAGAFAQSMSLLGDDADAGGVNFMDCDSSEDMAGEQKQSFMN